MAPISAVIWRAVAAAIAIAWIGVTVTRITVPIVAGIRRIVGVACVTGTVARVTGIDVDGNALGGCLERHERALTDLRSGPGFNGEAESSCLAAEGVS